MPSIVHRSEVNVPKVASENHEGNPVLLPSFQALSVAGKSNYYTIPIQPTAPTNAIANGSQIIYNLEPSEVPEIKTAYLRLTISATSDVQLAPIYHIFDYYTIEFQRGLSEEVVRVYPISMLMWVYTTMSKEQRQEWEKLSGYAVTHFEGEKRDKYGVNSSTFIRANDSRDFYIPIPVGFLHMSALDMRHISGDIRIKLRLATSGNSVLSGTVADISLDAVDLVVSSHDEEMYDKQKSLKIQANNNHSYIFLDTELLSYNDKTLTASSETTYNLDQFVGKSPFMAVVIKNTTSVTGADRYDYYEVGSGGTFDIQNSGGQSMFANGTALREDQMYQHFNDETGHPAVKGLYVINWSNSMRKAQLGVIDGFMQFYGQKERLAINFGATGTAEVHTSTLSANAVAGNYRVYVNGETADNTNAYNTVASTIQAELRAIPKVLDRGYLPTVSGTFDAGPVVTTFNANRDGRVSDEIGLVDYHIADMAQTISTVVSTYGIRGFNTSSAYTTEIYLFKYRELNVDKNGFVSVRDL